jgi:chromosomal replication initiator protein
VVDHILEIPLPGRSFASSRVEAQDDPTAVTLPSFVAGPENRLVASAVGRLLDRAAAPASPTHEAVPAILALYGPSGTGKTHLARGLVQHSRAQHGIACAEYVTASDFRRRIVDALDDDSIVQFRRQLRDCKLLAVDDIDKLPQKGHVQEEFRYTIDAIEAAGGTLVVTSARPAAALANLSADLRSRLSAGLSLQLAPPGTAARQRLLSQATTALGRPLSDDATHRLAEGISGTAHDLFAAVFELLATRPRRPANDARWAQGYLATRATRRPPLRQIIAVVAKHCGVPQKVLKSSSRRQAAVFARALAVYLARELTDVSYEQIGRALGGRDHTTMMHSYRKIQLDLRCHQATRESIDELRRILLSP